MPKIIVVTQPGQTVFVGQNDIVEIDIPGGGFVLIKAEPGSNVDKFKVHFKGDDQADTAKIDLATFSQNDLHIDIQHYDPTDSVELIGGFNKGVDPDDEDEFTFSYIGATGNTFNGYVHAKDGGERDFNADPSPVIICFAEGTMIDMGWGAQCVESLSVGDMVPTRDHGLQPIRWVGHRHLDSLDLARHPSLCPIRIAPGALGGSFPLTELTLSPQHRVHVADWRTEYLFGESSILVAVKHLVDGNGITIDRDAESVCYYHLLFDRHEIVTANGAPVESLHPGDMAMAALDDPDRDEIHLLFPDLVAGPDPRATADPVLRGFEAEALGTYAA